MKWIRTAAPIAAAAIAGYLAGALRTTAVVEAARDDAQTLMALDREFDEATAANGVEGWASYFAEDAIMLPVGEKIVMGKQAIRELMTPSFADPNFKLRWEPIAADASGNLGYTYGLYQASRVRDGQTVVSHGKYLTVWKKQRDRTWKAVADIGNTSPPPEKK